MSGATARTSASPMPMRSTTPGRKFWINTSAPSQSFSSACFAGVSLRFSATDRLLRLLLRKFAEKPFCLFAEARV